ncbi:MAG: serine/threonine protein kinase, partial [Pirellula sp.]|nr:serine/threonine protein kinase [Pirellula sp.]
MAESNHPLNNDSLRRAIEIDSVCDDFEELLHRGEKPQIERFLERVEAAHRHSLLVELIGIEAYFRRKMGEALNEAEYMARFPGLSVNRLGETLQQEPSPNGEHNARPSSAAEQDTIDSVGERKSTQTTPFIKYFGDYELLEVIARGGMGVVYRARQTTLNRIVALKMILSAEFASSEEVERFYSEAQAAALLDHPGIVPIYEVGEYEGKHFYSMTYVEGESLASKTSTIPLSPKEAAGIVKEVAMAVEYAHQKGIIHRDIKPSNILIDIQGRPRVTDFGLAKRLTGESGLTVTGQVLGTPSYMPPEQASGRINAVGPAADVYAMGAVLYSITTGRPPFQSASSVDTLRQVVDQEPVSPRQLNPSLPIDLETIILKCLEKSVPRRYPSAQSLSDELGRFLEGKPIEARPIRRIAKAWRWCRRSPVIASLIASLILVLLSGIGVSTYFAWKERQRATSESLARNNEKKMRELAERNERNAKESEESARRALYTARINLAQSAFDDNKMSRTLRLLEDIRADVKPGGSDNRSYEWYHLWQECYRGHRFTLRGHT